MRFGLVVVTVLVLSGGAAGNRHAYHSVLATPALSGSAQVGIATHDQRPYVLSGNKQPQFVGEAVPRAFKGKLEELLNDAAVTAALTSGAPAR